MELRSRSAKNQGTARRSSLWETSWKRTRLAGVSSQGFSAMSWKLPARVRTLRENSPAEEAGQASVTKAERSRTLR